MRNKLTFLSIYTILLLSITKQIHQNNVRGNEKIYGNSKLLAQDPNVIYKTVPVYENGQAQNNQPNIQYVNQPAQDQGQPNVQYVNQPSTQYQNQPNVQYVNQPSQEQNKPKVEYVNQPQTNQDQNSGQPQTNQDQNSGQPQVRYVNQPAQDQNSNQPKVKYVNKPQVKYVNQPKVKYANQNKDNSIRDPRFGVVYINIDDPYYQSINWNDPRYSDETMRANLFRDKQGNWKEPRFSNKDFRNFFFGKMKDKFNRRLAKQEKAANKKKIKNPLKPKIKCKVNLDTNKLSKKQKERMGVVNLAEIEDIANSEYIQFSNHQKKLKMSNLAQDLTLKKEKLFLKKIRDMRNRDLKFFAQKKY